MKSILVIRRDNIGDLVCTTPLLAALRQRFPQAWLGAFANSYNAPVLEGNPDLSEVLVYTKSKHLKSAESFYGNLLKTSKTYIRLRGKALDCVILASPGFSARELQRARWLAPKEIVGFSDGSAAARGLDRSVPLSQVRGMHEVEAVFSLAAHFGMTGEIPPLKVVPDSIQVREMQEKLRQTPFRIAVHISARRASQRWPAERYAQLIDGLGAPALLLWSPGAEDHPQHPGDDRKAGEILASARGKAIPVQTPKLQTLIAALSLCDLVVCPDGGAMHIAAALGKPVVALFGDSPPERWRPWGVPHRVLRAPSRDVRDIGAAEVISAVASLRSPGRTPGSTP